MTHRWADALADLDVVLGDLTQQRAPNFDRVLVARQQRAMCLRALDRAPEAVAELDQILAATVMWPPGHPLIDNVRAMRSGLLDRLASMR